MAEQPKDQREIDCKIRLYQTGDEDKIVQLLNKVFDPWPKLDIACSPVDHWRWKFLDNPANRKVIPHTVTDYKGEVVGVTHSMFFYTKIGINPYLCHKSVDVAVDPDFRGLGLFTKMDKLKQKASEGYQFETSLTSNPLLLYRRRQDEAFPFPQPLRSLIRIKNMDDHFNHTLKEMDPYRRLYLKIGAFGLKIINLLMNFSIRTPQLKGVVFKEISMFDDRINVFYGKIKPHYNYVMELTKDYLNWRYCDKRGGDFKVWIAEEKEEIVGYLILRINKIDADYPVGYIIDVVALDGMDDVVDKFVKLAVDYFDENHLNVARAQLIGGHHYERILNKYGFLNSHEKIFLRYRALKIGDDREKFEKSLADMMLYNYGNGDTI